MSAYSGFVMLNLFQHNAPPSIVILKQVQDDEIGVGVQDEEFGAEALDDEFGVSVLSDDIGAEALDHEAGAFSQ